MAVASSSAALTEAAPICRKHGHPVELTQECCRQMGTWANQLEGIAAYIAQRKEESIGHSLPIAGSKPKHEWCDLNWLEYDEYVACECQRSSLMEFVGTNVTLQCPDGQDQEKHSSVTAESDYQCLPAVCTHQDAKNMLLEKERAFEKEHCQITHVGGRPWRGFEAADSLKQQQEEEDNNNSIHIGVFIGISVFLLVVLAGAFLRTAGRKQVNRHLPPEPPCYEDDVPKEDLAEDTFQDEEETRDVDDDMVAIPIEDPVPFTIT